MMTGPIQQIVVNADGLGTYFGITAPNVFCNDALSLAIRHLSRLCYSGLLQHSFFVYRVSPGKAEVILETNELFPTILTTRMSADYILVHFGPHFVMSPKEKASVILRLASRDALSSAEELVVQAAITGAYNEESLAVLDATHHRLLIKEDEHADCHK